MWRTWMHRAEGNTLNRFTTKKDTRRGKPARFITCWGKYPLIKIGSSDYVMRADLPSRRASRCEPEYDGCNLRGIACEIPSCVPWQAKNGRIERNGISGRTEAGGFAGDTYGSVMFHIWRLSFSAETPLKPAPYGSRKAGKRTHQMQWDTGRTESGRFDLQGPVSQSTGQSDRSRL